MSLFDTITSNLTRINEEAKNSLRGLRNRLPRSVNPPNPSNETTDSGWSSQGASYYPSRKRQRQPFKWG